jgi:hypothetical protein
MCLTVFVSSFFLYALYRFPVELIDRLYQCACHLGTWVEVPADDEKRSGLVHLETQRVETWHGNAREFSQHDDIVNVPGVGRFCAKRHPHYNKIAASPTNELHQTIYVSY